MSIHEDIDSACRKIECGEIEGGIIAIFKEDENGLKDTRKAMLTALYYGLKVEIEPDRGIVYIKAIKKQQKGGHDDNQDSLWFRRWEPGQRGKA